MSLRAISQTFLLLALGLTAAVAPTYATVLFRNSGTLSGWDGQSIDPGTQGKVAEVTNVVLKGPAAIKSTQTFLGASYKGRYHAEVYRNDGYKPGHTRYYGFAFRLEDKWQFVQQRFNLAQFIADFTSDSDGCDDWMPSTMVFIEGNTLKTRAKSGDICHQQTKNHNIGTVQSGKWHKLVLGVSWRADGSGFLRAWLDGAQKLNLDNIPTTIADAKNRRFSFRVGLYANGWHDDKQVREGSQDFRQVWYDEIAIATTKNEVEPGSW